LSDEKPMIDRAVGVLNKVKSAVLTAGSTWNFQHLTGHAVSPSFNCDSSNVFEGRNRFGERIIIEGLECNHLVPVRGWDKLPF
jgi:hypothetical protein